MKTRLLSDSEGPAESHLCLSSPTVAILGSGDFSRSLAVRLVASGVRVVVGSSCVNRIPSGLFPDAVELRNQEGAVSQAVCLVFMALFPEHRGGKSTKIFYSSKSTITLLKFYLSTSKSTSLKIYSSKSKK